MTTAPQDRAAEAFAAELARWRTERGLSKKQLANQMGFDPSYVSHVEGRRHRPIYDLDSFKEVWLLFENDQGRFPLYRGQRTTISYTYHVREEKWGQWFQRAVRLPTRRLTVQLDFPTSREPMVWGVQTSLTAESALRTPVERSG